MIPKFRAWYKNGTLPMLMVSSISFDHKFLDVYIDEAFKLETEITIDFDDVVLMQSTGLFDRNGVEIFEGDVVESTWWNIKNERYRKRGVVELRYGCFGIRHAEDREDDVIQGLFAAIAPEVIGNIYENPELVAE